MKSLLLAIRSKEGKSSLIGIAVGILITCLGGYFLKDNVVMCDFVCIAGAIFSMVGAERICRLIIQIREEIGED